MTKTKNRKARTCHNNKQQQTSDSGVGQHAQAKQGAYANSAQTTGDEGHTGSLQHYERALSPTKRKRRAMLGLPNIQQEHADSDSVGHFCQAQQQIYADASVGGEDEGLSSNQKQSGHAPILALADLYRTRRWHYRKKQAILYPTYALARSFLGVSKLEKGSKARAEACSVAKAAVDAIVAGKDPVCPPEVADVLKSRITEGGDDIYVRNLQILVDRYEAKMKEVVQTIPIWNWAKEIRGLGAINVANIVAEAGDIGAYPNHSALWYKFGLAPPDSYKRVMESGKVAFVKPLERRAVSWNMGDGLMKGNFAKPPKDLSDDEAKAFRDANPLEYRRIFIESRDVYAEKFPDWSKLHNMRAAHRYMEKKLLRDMYNEWRRIEREGHSNREGCSVTVTATSATANTADAAAEGPPKARRRGTKRAVQQPRKGAAARAELVEARGDDRGCPWHNAYAACGCDP